MPPTSTVISGAVRVSRLARSSSSVSGDSFSPGAQVVAEPVGRAARAPRTTRRRSAPARRRCGPGANGTVTWCRRPSPPARPPRSRQHDEVGQRDLLAAGLRGVEVLLDLLERRQHRRRARPGSLTSQSFCGARRMRAPLAPPRLSVPRKLAADAQAVRDQLRRPTGPESRIVRLERGDVARRRPARGRPRGTGSCHSCGSGDPRAEVARDRSHVAVQQLVPGLGERLGELVGVLEEAPGDRLVDRVHAQRQVGGQHRRRVPLRRVRARRAPCPRSASFGLPLLRAGRALGQLPLVAEQGLEEAVVPLRRRRRPGALQPAGDRVGALAGAVAVLPAEALLLERGALRLRADVARRSAGAVGLAEGVAAGDQRDRLLVVHRHPARTSRGCRGPRPAGRACRSGPPG